MTIENMIELDGRLLSVFKKENTWKIFKSMRKQYSPVII